MDRLPALDRRLLDEFQRDLPLVPRPFAEMAAVLAVSEAEVLARLNALQAAGTIARVGATVRPNTAGASTLAALAVPEARVDEVAALVGNGDLAEQLYQLACHLLNWTLTPNVLGIYRVAMAESQRFPELARKVFTSPVAGSGAQVAGLLRAHLGDRLDPQEARIMSMHFLSSAISPPFMRAMQGLVPPELTDVQRLHLKRVIGWYLDGVLPKTGAV